MGDAIPLPEPAYYQWRRKKMPWSLEFAFSHMCVETTDDSEVRTLHTADQMHAHASAVTAAARDCRTCAHHPGCAGSDLYRAQNCINGNRYEPLPPVRLWRSAP